MSTGPGTPIPGLTKILASLAPRQGDAPGASRTYDDQVIVMKVTQADSGNNVGIGIHTDMQTAAQICSLIDGAPVPPPAPKPPAPPPTPTPPAGANWTPPTFPRHSPAIGNLAINYGKQSATPFGQTLCKNNLDIIIGGETDFPNIKAAWPGGIRALYINVSDVGQLWLEDWNAWATAHVLDPENAFLHAVAPPTTANRILSTYGGTRYAANAAHPDWQRWVVDFARRQLAANPAANAFFVDNSHRPWPVGGPDPANIEGVTSASWVAGYAATMQQVAALVAGQAILNAAGGADLDKPIYTGGVGHPLWWVESWLRPMSTNADAFAGWLALFSQYRALASPPAYVGIDANPTGGSPTDPRTQMAALAMYHLVSDPATTFFSAWGGQDTMGDWQAGGHWWNAIAQDLGTPVGPLGTPRPECPTCGTFATGPDPAITTAGGPSYTVFGRQWTKGLVLAKPTSGNWSNPGPAPGAAGNDASATTHDISAIRPGTSWAILNADGTKGAPVNSVTLRNNEGVILVPA